MLFAVVWLKVCEGYFQVTDEVRLVFVVFGFLQILFPMSIHVVHSAINECSYFTDDAWTNSCASPLT